jgi:hypothetical protein
MPDSLRKELIELCQTAHNARPGDNVADFLDPWLEKNAGHFVQGSEADMRGVDPLDLRNVDALMRAIVVHDHERQAWNRIVAALRASQGKAQGEEA